METPTVTVRKAIELFNHLKTLNGREVVVRTVGKPDRVVMETYQFDGKTTWNIAKNLNVLKKHVEVFEDSRANIAASIGGEKGIDESNPAQMEEFTKRISEVLDQEVSLLGVLELSVAGLNLDQNAIQPGVLAALADIIKE